jgi:hypothetical protein
MFWQSEIIRRCSLITRIDQAATFLSAAVSFIDERAIERAANCMKTLFNCLKSWKERLFVSGLKNETFQPK